MDDTDLITYLSDRITKHKELEVFTEDIINSIIGRKHVRSVFVVDKDNYYKLSKIQISRKFDHDRIIKLYWVLGPDDIIMSHNIRSDSYYTLIQ